MRAAGWPGRAGAGLLLAVLLVALPGHAIADRVESMKITRDGAVIVDRSTRTDIRLRRNPATGGYDIYDRNGDRIGYGRPPTKDGTIELFSPDGTRGIKTRR